LTLKYFNKNEYHIFDQNDSKYGNDFWKMLKIKINTGINIAADTNADIIFWAGSNDYISSDFFEQVINEYSSQENQLYGIDSFKNGENANLYNIYDGETNTLDIYNNIFWWDGEQNHQRQFCKYTGGIIGLNKKLYCSHPEILKMWNYDEGMVEQFALQFHDVHKFNSKKIFWMNTKTKSATEINSYANNHNHFTKENQILDEKLISYKEKIYDEIDYVLHLISNI
jgi:hypothetical protein